MEVRKRKHAQQIVINGCQRGLGIRVVGGRNVASDLEKDFGIFIKQILPGSLAAQDGRLQRGDQLLESNGTSLMGVSNESIERAVEILKACAATDSISLWVSRDSESLSDFHRLSNSLLLQPIAKDGPPQVYPLATSTPRVAYTTAENGYKENRPLETTGQPGQVGLTTIRESVTSDTAVTDTDAPTRRSSTASDLTHISTTDISSHGDEESDHENLNTNMNNATEVAMPTVTMQLPTTGITPSGESRGEGSPKSLDLSDVVVSVGSSTLLDSTVTTTASHMVPSSVLNGPDSRRDSDETLPPPPPVPLSPPPDDQLEDSSPPPIPTSPPPFSTGELVKQQPARTEVTITTTTSAATLRSRSSPEGMSSASPPISPLPHSPILHTFSISKLTGLGVLISGGVNKPDGPHILIEKVLDGMDAAKDGRLQKGDRILAVNGESFTNLTREKALTILTQLKLRPQVKTYTVTVERTQDPLSPHSGTSSPPSLPQPPHTTTTSTIFDSDTIPLSDEVPTTKEGGGRRTTTPSRYLIKKDKTSVQDKLKHDSLHKRLSLDPNARVKLTKLEWALTYMGHTLSPQQQQKIHSSLDVDEQGKVVFLDFVKLAQEMFAFHLEDSHLEENLVFALTQKDSLEMPPIPKKATSFDQLWKEYSPLSSQLKLTSSQPTLPQSPSPTGTSTGQKWEAELDQMRRQLHDMGQRRDQERLIGASSEVEKLRVEREKALQDVARLKMQLSQKERECQELELFREIPPGSSGEAQALRKRLGLAEAAARAAREKEHQMKETMQCMETELAGLRERQAQLSSSELRRRLATLDCQLKKEQQISRHYQVAAERLLQFTENCHEALVKSPDADRILYHPHGKGESVVRGDAVTGNPRPPQYLSRHAKVTATTLTQEAKETITAVRKLLEAQTLPYGWEEAYTEDGQKYFINHETQSTSWVHPVTRVAPGTTSRSSTPASRSRASSHSSLAAAHGVVPKPVRAM